MRQFSRFYETLINESNHNAAVRGAVAPARPERGSSFIPPSRMLKCSLNAQVKPGDILRSKEGFHFITGFGGSNHDTFIFNLFDLSDQVDWKRSVATIDPVTKFKKDTGTPTDMGKIWCAILPKGKVTEAAAKLQAYDIICGADIQVGDTLNGLNVTSVVKQQGVIIAEAS